MEMKPVSCKGMSSAQQLTPPGKSKNRYRYQDHSTPPTAPVVKAVAEKTAT